MGGSLRSTPSRGSMQSHINLFLLRPGLPQLDPQGVFLTECVWSHHRNLHLLWGKKFKTLVILILPSCFVVLVAILQCDLLTFPFPCVSLHFPKFVLHFFLQARRAGQLR